MTILRYRPASTGGWIIVADGPRALIVGPSGWRLADAAAEVVGGEGGFEATVDIITRAGFAAIPDFVLLEWTDVRVRSLLRGPVTLAVTDGAGEHTQDGSGISTWTERSFTGATAVQARIDGAAEVEAVDSLSLRTGSALLASCALDFSADPAESASLRPAASVPASSQATAASSASTVSPSESTAPSGRTVPAVSEELQERTQVPSTETIVPSTTPSTGVGRVSDETIVRSSGVQPAAADTIAPPPTASGERAGDHDGNTILSSDIARLRAGRGRKPDPVESPPAERAPSIFLTLPDGSRELLDQPALIGRSPSVSKVAGDRMPRLITVGDGDQDISRNHAQFAVEGDTVVVTDLHSRNGTMILLPGKSPQKLRAGEPTSVIIGTVVDLGGGITLTVGVQ